MTVTPDSSRRKEARLAMRLAPDQDALIRHAAAITGPDSCHRGVSLSA
ncbi:MAG: hypothetical protein WAS01_06985 [Nostocoides sp.]